jgi:beta-lactamase regulating signal transducer with metallopeptidase domain
MTSSFITAIQGYFLKTAEISFHASLIIGVLLLARPLIKSLLPARWIYLLWFIVIARLLLTGVPGLPAQVAAQPLAAPLVAVQNLNDADIASVPLIQSAASGFHLIDWQPALALVWLAGALAFLLHFGISHFRWTRRLAKASTVPHEVIQQLVAACCHEMGVRPVHLVQLPGSISPSIAGLFRPTIILPDDCGYRFSREELRWVILHELAHLRRWDLPVQFISQVLQAIHWFNPLVWIAFACLRHDRELACDAHVLDRQAQNTSLDYGHTLIKVAETYPHPALAPGFLGISEEQSNLQERVEKIGRHRRPVLLWSVCSLLLCALLAVVFLTRLDQPAHVATAKIRVLTSGDQIPAQIEIIQSSDTVVPAIKSLGLDKIWAKRYGSNGDAWALPEIMDHVSKILTLEQRPGAPQILYINVQGEPPQEAADIANALVEQYKGTLDTKDRERNAKGAADFIQPDVERIGRDLVAHKAELEKMKRAFAAATAGVSAANESQAQIDQNLAQFNVQKAQQQQRVDQAQARLDDVKAQQQRAMDHANDSFRSDVEILARAY